jgi:protein-tyrosine phosphatase
MVDIHCHVLPSIDDGARSWEIAETMCAMAFADGITHIVATPHSNPEYKYERNAFSRLLAELQFRTQDKITFSLGCDFHLSLENLSALFLDPAQFVIGNTKYLLIELNDFSIPPNYEALLFRIRSELGITPILTHPERHPILQLKPEQALRWIKAGCMIQVTANSLTGDWGRRAQSATTWLLKHEAVHVIATDAHDPSHRPPILSKAREIAAGLIGRRNASKLVEDNPLAIIQGRELLV